MASILVLLALPVAVLVTLVLGTGDEVVIHLMLAAGFALLALAVFDFRLPSWITWVGSGASGGLATIFLLQGLGSLDPNGALHQVAFGQLGHVPESVLADLFLAWCVALLLGDSQGKTRRFGLVVIPLVVVVELYRSGVRAQGGVPPGSLLLVFLLLVVWLLLEAKKQRSYRDSPSR